MLLPTSDERRDLALTDAGVSVQPTADETPRFVGHAAVFNKRTAIGNPRTWGFYEQIAPGAFTKTLAEADVRMLIDHNPAMVVSRTRAGTLELVQDDYGLRVDSALDTDLSYVADLVTNLRNGNITGMSFGFQVVKDDWATEEERSADGEPFEVEVRTVREVKLIEVSAVTFPAYEETDAGLRHSLVPALRNRGDATALERVVRHRPELAELLGYEPRNEERESDPKKPYGDVEYADPGYQEDGVKRYPIDTKEHALAAWSYINQEDNAAKYTAEQLAAIKARIRAALKRFGVDVDESKSGSEPGETTHAALAPEAQERANADEEVEPAASTRYAPSQHELAKARLLVMKTKLRHPLA